MSPGPRTTVHASTDGWAPAGCRRLRVLGVSLATALAYALLGCAALSLAVPPSAASPFYPSSGVALACALRYGWRALPGVALGACVVNLAFPGWYGTLSPSSVAAALAIGCGAAAQAAVGAALIRRHLPGPLTLAEPRDVARFVAFGAVASCLVSAGVATLALGLAGIVPPSELAFAWLTWWIGDTLGVLVAAPVVLTLIGRPADAWRPRIPTVGVTLTVGTALVAALVAQVYRWDDERVHRSFERDAGSTAALVAERLQGPLDALQAVYGVYAASDAVSGDEFVRGSTLWLDRVPSLQALGWAERVGRADVTWFEADARAQGAAGFHVLDRAALDGAAQSPADDEVVAVRFIEPLRANAGALGMNGLSIPETRAAIDAARRTGRTVASAAFVPPPVAGQHAAPGRRVVVLRAVYRGRPAGEDARLDATRGLVFATLDVEQALRRLLADMPRYLSACLFDPQAPHAARVLFGPPQCDAAAPRGPLLERELPFAGRQWRLRLTAPWHAVPGAEHANAWPFAVFGLLATALLGSLLLAVTGRTRRIQSAVQERTAALVQEIRDRERTERALRDSETRFRNIFNNVPIGVVYTDLDGRVKEANPRFCDLVGHSAEALAAMNSRDFIHPEDRAAGAALAARLVRGDVPMYRRDERCVASDGRVVWVKSVVTLLRDAHGAPHRIVSVVEDISEHLKLEEAERARDRAESSNQAKSDFLSRMSHELRTPLNAMLGFAQLLDMDARQPLAETHRAWVAQIQSAGWHLLDMINDVLDLSRIDAGTLRLSSDKLDLEALVAASWSLVGAQAGRRGIALTQDIAGDATLVLADATRLKQILINLLSNAVKYNVDGGRIHVSAQPAGDDQVEIAVIDTGLGMTPEQLTSLFQPFNRLGRERSSQEGTGIGLVISRRLAELMGGALRVRSKAGVGSSFVLTLPRVVEPDTVRSDLDEAPAAPVGYRHRRVHYVEDNETNVEVMRGILAQRPQVRLDVSFAGEDGLEAIRTLPPDLVLLDMHLPDIDGMELLRRLKADPRTASVPVVFVSADALPAQIEAARSAGAAGYLTKPLSVAELLAVVDATLNRGDAPSE